MSWGTQLPADGKQFEDPETIIRKLIRATRDSIQYYVRQVKEDGQVGDETDLGSYAKLPNALIMAGYPKEAGLVIDYCLNNFFCKETGDFYTNPQTRLKSSKKVFEVFYPYTNEWLLQAGLKLRRYEYTFKAAQFIDNFYNSKVHASTIIAPYNSNNEGNVHCIFNSAALGTTYLYLNRLDRSTKIGDTMVKVLYKQRESMFNSKDHTYYLRYNDNLEFFKELTPAKGERLIYKIVGSKVKQAWFAIGYPVAFLGQLYNITKNRKYFDAGEYLLDYAINCCNKDVRNNQWAHKLMWGASIFAVITNKQEYWDLVFDLVYTIVDNQDPKTGLTSGIFDQCAEMAFWMPIIAMNIRRALNMYGELGNSAGMKLVSKNKSSKL